MGGDRCPIIHRLNPKARVDIKNGQLKAMKAALRFSRRHVHTLIFKVGFYFQLLTITKPIIKEAPIYLGHQCPAIRFICCSCQLNDTYSMVKHLYMYFLIKLIVWKCKHLLIYSLWDFRCQIVGFISLAQKRINCVTLVSRLGFCSLAPTMGGTVKNCNLWGCLLIHPYFIPLQ